jgi:transcriptional regulator with XRE-family HTH domain
MDERTLDDGLAFKITRLVKERGWNQEEFARITRLNRHTVRQILAEGGPRRLRNATVSACARALGLSVNDLRTLPLERLLPRMSKQAQELASTSDSLRRLYDQATQPELLAWMDRNPERARQLSAEEIDELVSLQGPGGPLTTMGVEGYVKRQERRRHLIQQINAISVTEFMELLEQLVGLIYEKVQPNRDGVMSAP